MKAWIICSNNFYKLRRRAWVLNDNATFELNAKSMTQILSKKQSKTVLPLLLCLDTFTYLCHLIYNYSLCLL